MRIVIPMCGGDWHVVGKFELGKPRCSSGLLKLFVAAALGRVISPSLKAVVREGDLPSVKALRLV